MSECSHVYGLPLPIQGFDSAGSLSQLLEDYGGSVEKDIYVLNSNPSGLKIRGCKKCNQLFIHKTEEP